MAGINLVIDQYVKRQSSLGSISLCKSNANHIATIPYHMESYTPLLDHLSSLVLPEWQAEITSILQEERDLIKRRQSLMASYKEQLATLLPPLIDQFKTDHPEYFI